jgi:hypothetical protein
VIRTHLTTLPLALALASSVACRDAVPSLGTTPERATSNATTMLNALADRFGPIELSPEIARARPRLARYSTTPSRLVDDKATWTSRGADDRTLEIAGVRRGGSYVLLHHHGVPAPRVPGDARHVMRLHVLGDDEYRWTSLDEVALGSITVADLDRALTAILLAAERSDGDATRLAARTAFPRASASLARMFVIDSLRTERDTDGATSVVLGLGLRPSRAAQSFTALGSYARKYWVPLRWRLTVRDSSGTGWGTFAKRDSSLVLRFRVKDGSLAPVGAPPRRADSVLHLTVDASAKVGPFRVGMRGLDVRASRSASGAEMAMTFRFVDQPEWQLPPLVARLLRSPLRRPFEGSGALIRYGVRTETPASDTISTVWRDIDVTVRESAILRFFGRLGGTALGDFRAGAEKEAERLWGETLRGMAEDIKAIAGCPEGTRGLRSANKTVSVCTF